MSLIFITGIAGSGKSTVLNELSARGYDVRDADDNLSAWENKTTRDRISSSDHRLTTNPKFFEEHDWYIDREGTADLAKSAITKDIFLGGSVANEEEVWSEFSKVLCLYVDDETLKQRIQARTDKDFGKSEHELNHLLELNREVKRKYTSLGATLIDATKPIDRVVDEILSSLRR